MPFEWSTYIDVARKLARGNASEADLRSSVSRSYYSAFGEIRAFLEGERKSSFPAMQVHHLIIETLTAHSDIKRKLLGVGLKDLRTARARADYDSNSVVGIEDARKAIDAAERLLDALRLLRE